MKYALYVPNFGAFGEVSALVKLATTAEQAGWDGLFLWDHISNGAGFPSADPIVALGAIAQATSKLITGTMITPLPRRRPHKFAREMTSLDRFSNGRLVVGVGIGEGQHEWDFLGEEADLKTRGAMLDEGLAVITGLWQSGSQPFSFDGEHYSIQETRFAPEPLQQPRIPIWVAGRWPGSVPFKRAARWDGVFPIPGPPDALRQLSPAEIREVVAFVAEHRADGMPFDVAMIGYFSLDDRAANMQSVADYEAAGVTWWMDNMWLARFAADWQPGDPYPLDEIMAYVQGGPPVTL